MHSHNGDAVSSKQHSTGSQKGGNRNSNSEQKDEQQRTNNFYCLYCKINFNNEDELNNHCATESHQLAITKDDDKKWSFRPPPRGLKRKHLTLCQEIATKGSCRLGDQCLGAHTDVELEEWQERLAYREWKMEKAKSEHLNGSSYAEQLLEKYVKAIDPETIMRESIEGITLQVEPKLFATFSAKNSTHAWTFKLKTQRPLIAVSLLYDSHRKYFGIQSMTSDDRNIKLDQECQEWFHPNLSQMLARSGSPSQENHFYSYIMKIRFETDIFGTFRQSLILDFGIYPVIQQKLCVDVVPPDDLAHLEEVRETVLCVTERWNSSNTLCVPFDSKTQTYSDDDLRLINLYPIPNPNTFTITQAVASPLPTESMYKSRFHELLYIEEMAQYNLITRFNVSSKLQLVDSYILAPGTTSIMKYAQKGELYACMKLSSEVSEDLPAGRMIQTNCSSVFLAPIVPVSKKAEIPTGKRKVFEAIIEDKGKKMIYLRLPKQCVTEFNLKPDREYVAEVQFQLNRMPFCEMHYSVDGLGPVSLVFPEIEKPILIPPADPNNPPWDLALNERLNPKQKEAITAICAPNNINLPPILIIGPFGTGKTFTLAQAVKALLKNPENRVLVCTHSNSAADIYIREYLHPFVEEGHPEAEPLRVYYQHRWVATVHQTVLKYCLVNEKESSITFRLPTVEDLDKKKIVVTTLSCSRYLVNLNLPKNFFTHILIDEAAQAMESEAIMPLALAGLDTRIALAGDHMQLSPEVYSSFAVDKNLQLSLLERLFDLYKKDYPCKILLCENYRSHKAIVQYTSDMFYQNSLLASKDQPKHKTFFPLTFFTARGEDVQDTNSTAFYNNSEVYEVAERVLEIHRSWPTEWGPVNDASIGVVTPYYDQVVRLRTELRKRKLHHVSVERVLNVQGKQFRAIVLSTVRTLQTCGTGKGMNGEELDYGFLSNARLLNTAITRGQSLVAVCGDPVSLCSMGGCRKLWEKFIRICYDNDSLYGISWQTLQTQLDGLELKKTYMLNPLAPEFIPRRMRVKALQQHYSVVPSSSSTNNAIANGSSGFFGTPPPPQNFCNPQISNSGFSNSNVSTNSSTPQIPQQDGIAPMYTVNPFQVPDLYNLSYNYMGMPVPPLPPHFMQIPYNGPQYGYPPWWMGNKGNPNQQPSVSNTLTSTTMNPIGAIGNREASKLATIQRLYEKSKNGEGFMGDVGSMPNMNLNNIRTGGSKPLHFRGQIDGSMSNETEDGERSSMSSELNKRFNERFFRLSDRMKQMDNSLSYNNMGVNGPMQPNSRMERNIRDFKKENMLTHEQKQRLCLLEAAYHNQVFNPVPRRNSLEGGGVPNSSNPAGLPNPVGSQRGVNNHIQDHVEDGNQIHQNQMPMHQNQIGQEQGFQGHFMQHQDRFMNPEEFLHHQQQQQQQQQQQHHLHQQQQQQQQVQGPQPHPPAHLSFPHPRMMNVDDMPMKGFNGFDGMNGSVPPMMALRHLAMNNEMTQEQFAERFSQRFSGGNGDQFMDNGMPVENGFPRRRAVSATNPLTLEQVEAILLSQGSSNGVSIGGVDAAIQRRVLLEERHRQMKMREEQNVLRMNGFSDNIMQRFEEPSLSDRMARMYLSGVKPNNVGFNPMGGNERVFPPLPKGISIPEHQMNNQIGQSPLMNKEVMLQTTSPPQDYSIEKLLQVSAKVWAEPVFPSNNAPPPQQPPQAPQPQNYFGRALSENELFERHHQDRQNMAGLPLFGSFTSNTMGPIQNQQHHDQQPPQHRIVEDMNNFRPMLQANGQPLGGGHSMFANNMPPNMMAMNGGTPNNLPLGESRLLGHMTNGHDHEPAPPMMNGNMDKHEASRLGGGFNLFHHKTILTNEAEEDKGLYSNVF